MENLNLPPFYIGQKVVRTKDNRILPKGTVVTVTAQFQCSCGEWHMQWGQKIGAIATKTECFCGKNIISLNPNKTEYTAFQKYFKPLEEKPFPSLTLKEVIVKESELVSMN